MTSAEIQKSVPRFVPSNPFVWTSALSESEYREGLAASGLGDVEILLTHEVADGMHGAIVRARKPS